MLTMGGDIQVGVEQPIGTFFDGTNTYIRYRKVIQKNLGGSYAITHGITFTKVISLSAVLTRASDNLQIPVPFISTGGVNSSVGVYMNATTITITNPDNGHKNDDIIVVIEYYR